MNKKVFIKSIKRLIPGCSRKSIYSWIVFAEECIKVGQYADFKPADDRKAVEKWLDALYEKLCAAKQEYGKEPVKKICRMSVKHSLYPWEMMRAAEYFKNGGSIDGAVWLSIEGMLDEY